MWFFRGMDFIEWVMLAIVAAVVGLLGLAVWSAPWHNLVCKKGHYETVTVKAHLSNQTGLVGDKVIVVPVWIPEHEEQAWVCDEKTGGAR